MYRPIACISKKDCPSILLVRVDKINVRVIVHYGDTTNPINENIITLPEVDNLINKFCQLKYMVLRRTIFKKKPKKFKRNFDEVIRYSGNKY